MQQDVVLWGDCLEVLKTFPDESVDAVVTDPPYGLGSREPSPEEILAFLSGGTLDTGGDFMGADWEIPSVRVWQECYRVLKPGGHLVSMAGTRTWDLMSMAIRMAGFTDRDTIASIYGGVLIWLRGQGFPKNLDVSRAVDKAARGCGQGRPDPESPLHGQYKHQKVAGNTKNDIDGYYASLKPGIRKSVPATPEAEEWQGWGTALKPMWEPILVFRKPLEGTVVNNVLKYGTGALNIDGCRVGAGETLKGGGGKLWSHYRDGTEDKAEPKINEGSGRWPPNVTLVHLPECRQVGTRKVQGPTINRFDDGMKPFGDGAGHPYEASEGGEIEEPIFECAEGCPVKAVGEQSGVSRSTGGVRGGTIGATGIYGHHEPAVRANAGGLGDEGTAARFFPQFEGQTIPDAPFKYVAKVSPSESTLGGLIENKHPTRKPLELMKWLVRLVTPPGGVVLDPYCGSGTTLHAAVELEMHYVGVERDPVYHDTATKRLRIVEERERDVQHARSVTAMIGELEEE